MRQLRKPVHLHTSQDADTNFESKTLAKVETTQGKQMIQDVLQTSEMRVVLGLISCWGIKRQYVWCAHLTACVYNETRRPSHTCNACMVL